MNTKKNGMKRGRVGAVLFLAAASINHKGDQQNEPPAASNATAPAPGSTNAVLPQGAPAAKSGG